MGAAALERFLEGSELQRKSAAISLLSGLGAKLTRASDLPSSSAPRDPLPTTVAALDRLLLGGLPRGGFVEVSGRRSCGRFSIGIATLAAATSSGETAALVDLGSHLDPQSAEEAGVDLTRVLWVRPAKLKDAVASAEMTLSAGFPLVVLDLGLAPLRGGCRRPADGVSYCRGSAVGGRTVPDAAWVRLARAARQRHAMLLLLAPYRISGVAAEAVIAADAVRPVWRVAPTPGAPKLLAGVASRLTLQKDARARSGIAEQMGLRVDATLSIPSLSGHYPPHPNPYRRASHGVPFCRGSAFGGRVPPLGGEGEGATGERGTFSGLFSRAASDTPASSEQAVIPSAARDPGLDTRSSHASTGSLVG